MSDVDKALDLARKAVAVYDATGIADTDTLYLSRALLSLHRSHLAMAAVVEAAIEWRGQQVNVSSNPDKPYYIDSDDGNADQGLVREPTRNKLVAAVDTLRAAKGER